MGGTSFCLKECEDGSDCRESETYVCRGFAGGTVTFCLPPRPWGTQVSVFLPRTSLA